MTTSDTFPTDKKHEHSHHHNHDCCKHHHHLSEHNLKQHTSNTDIPDGYQQKTYLVDNLDCANCAAKIEAKLNELPEIYNATLTFLRNS